jgi:two-component system, OmpR family, sensor histidine kinase NblS
VGSIDHQPFETPPPEGPSPLGIWLRNVLATFAQWWSDFNIQTRLMVVATLVVSLLMSGLTFWAVNSIQQDTRMNDTRYGRDLGLLLAADVAPLVARHDYAGLADFSRKFYHRSSSIRYILYADEDGEIYYGIPFSESQVDNALTLRRRIQLPENYRANLELPMTRQHITPNGVVADVFVPLSMGDQYLGVMAIGINPNPTVVASSGLTRDVTIAVFISIWIMVILGAVINALTITRPIKELLVGVKNIASGNFKQRVDLPFGGELGELITSFNDMAERLERYEEQNIEELTAEKAKLETLVSTIADGAVLLDPEMRIILVNPAARHLFNWEAEIVGENALRCLPGPLCAELTRPLFQTLAGESEGGEFRVALPAPNPKTVRILLASVPDPYREKPKGIAMTVQDITREVELNEAKSQFISNVSHELRTPLFNIKSFIETLHEYGDNLSEVERREFLDTANRETDRLSRLVNDVLDLSRLESGKCYHFDGVDLVQAVEQILRTYQLNARDKGIELSQEIEPGLPAVWGNYDLLLQVFANLVGNAVKFTLNQGRVVIRAYSLPASSREEAGSGASVDGKPLPPQLVRIEVSDSGIGIAPEDQSAIFERFFRVENRVHTLEGTGLGLSIVQNIMQKHHSMMHLVSEVGVGTTFWFDLPVYLPGGGSSEISAVHGAGLTITGLSAPELAPLQPKT